MRATPEELPPARTRCLWPVFLTAACTAVAPPFAGDDERELTPEQWQDDVRFLSWELARIHPGVFDGSSRQEFDAATERLLAEIPALGSAEIVVRVMQHVARIRDAHTVMSAMSERERQSGRRRFFPVRLVKLGDALRVLSVPPDARDLLGAEVVRYGKVSIEEAARRVATVINHENPWGIERRLPFVLMLPVVLEGLGIVDTPDALVLELIDRTGAARRVTFRPIEGTARNTDWFKHTDGIPAAEYATLRDLARGPPPLSVQRGAPRRGMRDRYWFDFHAGTRTLYLQFNRVRDKREEPLRHFFARMWRAFDDRGAQRLIIDVRRNSGGNNQLLQPLLHGIIKRDLFDRAGRLFVLIGHGTNSAAVSLAARLDVETTAVFAGAPTAQRPNFYADPVPVQLPHSRMKAEVSRWFWQNTGPWDDRAAIFPRIVVEESLADVLANRDPLLARVLQLRDYRTLADALRETIDAGGRPRATLRRHLERLPDPWNTTERELATLGQTLLAEGKVAASRAVHEIQTEFFPDSASGWRGVAVTRLLAGEREAALAAFRKALALDPRNERVRQQVEQLSRQPPAGR